MGLVVVISLPLILFSLMLSVGCYLIGRARGRQDIRTHAQAFGVPIAPPNANAHSNGHVSSSTSTYCTKPIISEMV